METALQDDEIEDSTYEPINSSLIPFEVSSNRREFVEVRRIFDRPRRSHRKRPFSPWTAWSICDSYCKQKRERYCNIRRRCGQMKHVEERSCLEA